MSGLPNNTSAQATAFMTQAIELVSGDRQNDYGDFIGNVIRISALTGVQAMSVCDVLVALKQVRLEHTPDHTDSSIDLVAYAALREVARRRLIAEITEDISL